MPRRIVGRLELPGDKSLSHRALLFAAIAGGTAEISHLNPGDDVRATARALRSLGVAVRRRGATWRVQGLGAHEFVAPARPIDCANSGTTMRLFAGVLAAIGASVCCVGPLLLLMLGIGGAWVASLTALEPLRPWLIGATLLFLGLAFRRLYLQPQVCQAGKACAEPTMLGRQRWIFWIVALALVALLSVPWLAPFFL